jgi:hypothetical protein
VLAQRSGKRIRADDAAPALRKGRAAAKELLDKSSGK